MSGLREAAQQALEALKPFTVYGRAGSRDIEVGAAIAASDTLRAALAQQAEPDLSRCPQCNGPADNGFDRSFPPSPYLCTKCMAEPCPNYASLEAQNTELDRKLAEMKQAIEKLCKEILKE